MANRKYLEKNLMLKIRVLGGEKKNANIFSPTVKYEEKLPGFI